MTTVAPDFPVTRVAAGAGSLRRWRPDVGLLALLSVEVAFLLPVLATGYLGDDSLNSLIDGQLWLSHHGIVRWLLDFYDYAARGQGRFTPLANLHDFAVLHFVHSIVLYKALLVAVTVGATAVFGYVIRVLGGSRTAVYAALIFTIACFQLRLYHDGLTGYGGLVQTVLVYLLGSIGCFYRYLVGGRRLWMVAALALYAAACLSYESSFAFVLVHVAVALAVRRSPRQALRAATPLFVVALLFVGLTVYLRSTAIVPDPGYAISLDPGLVLPTMAKQLLAALPLAYVVLDPSHVPGGLPGDWSWSATFAGVAAFAAIVAVLARPPIRSARPRWLLPFVGAAFWVLPTLALALAPKYQHELVFGLGHPLVVIEDFGVGLLLGSGACEMSTRLARAPRARALIVGLVAAFGGVAIGATWQSNQRVVQIQVPGRNQRTLAETAGAAGLFGVLPPGTTVVTDEVDLGWPPVQTYPVYDWMPTAFFLVHGAAYVNARDIRTIGQPIYHCFSAAGSPLTSCPPAVAPLYRVRVRSGDGDRGAVFVSEMPAPHELAAADLLRLASARTTMYVRAPGRFAVVGRTDTGARWSIVSERLSRLRSGDDWGIYALPAVPVLPGSLRIVYGA